MNKLTVCLVSLAFLAVAAQANVYLGTNVVYTTNSTPAATSGLLVRYVDYDGTILSSQYVATNGNATAPANPSHPLLTFQEWNLDGTGIVQDTDIGASYITTDGKTYAYLNVSTITGLSNGVYVTKSDGSELTVSWGDGSTDLVTAAGAVTNVHNYPSNGQYVATLWISSGSGTYALGSDSTALSFIGGGATTNRDMLTTLFIGSNVTAITTGGCYNAYSLTAITIPTNVTRISTYALYQTWSMRQCTLPRGLQSIEAYMFQNGGLQSVAIPSTVSNIESTAFRSCTKLQRMAIPAGVTNIGTYGCANLYCVPSIILPSGLTQIAANALQTLSSATELTLPTNITSSGNSGLT